MAKAAERPSIAPLPSPNQSDTVKQQEEKVVEITALCSKEAKASVIDKPVQADHGPMKERTTPLEISKIPQSSDNTHVMDLTSESANDPHVCSMYSKRNCDCLTAA